MPIEASNILQVHPTFALVAIIVVTPAWAETSHPLLQGSAELIVRQAAGGGARLLAAIHAYLTVPYRACLESPVCPGRVSIPSIFRLWFCPTVRGGALCLGLLLTLELSPADPSPFDLGANHSNSLFHALDDNIVVSDGICAVLVWLDLTLACRRPENSLCAFGERPQLLI
jgi:hypothetical protein